MMVKFTNLILFFVAVCFVSCTEKEEMTAQQLLDYMTQNQDQYIVSKKIGDLNFTVKYQPAEFQAAQLIMNGQIKDRISLNECLKKKQGLKYFLIEIENNKSNKDPLLLRIQNEQEAMERVNYYSYDFENDIKFVPGTDTARCALFHYENSYGGAPVLRFVVAFESKDLKDGSIIIEDKIFKNGRLQFHIDNKMMSDVPSLII